MYSRANSTREDGPGLQDDTEAEERQLCDKGVQEDEGAADGMATPGLLPVPIPVEPEAPSLSRASSALNELLWRLPLGNTKTKPHQQKQSYP